MAEPLCGQTVRILLDGKSKLWSRQVYQRCHEVGIVDMTECLEDQSTTLLYERDLMVSHP